MSKELNYNTDLVKHYVRYYSWVQPFKTMLNYVDSEFKKNKRPSKLKYFTFCAVQAIDVFLFEHLKYVYRNPDTQRLENVYFCENDEESFSIIQSFIGGEEQGFFGDFKEIMLQEEPLASVPNQEEVIDPFDEPESSEEREKLRLRQLKERLTAKFPFDVINLDFYGNFFPNKETRYSDSLRTYRKLLTLQKEQREYECSRFLMYLTIYTPVFNETRFVNPTVIPAFEQVLLQNLAYPEFEAGFQSKYGHNRPQDVEVYIKFILGFAKQVIFRETYSLGWQPTLKSVHVYDRKHSDGMDYKITAFTVEYKRNSELDGVQDLQGVIADFVEEDYKSQIADLVLNKPEQVPDVEDIANEVEGNLTEVVSFRNDFLKEIGILDKNGDLFE